MCPQDGTRRHHGQSAYRNEQCQDWHVLLQSTSSAFVPLSIEQKHWCWSPPDGPCPVAHKRQHSNGHHAVPADSIVGAGEVYRRDCVGPAQCKVERVLLKKTGKRSLQGWKIQCSETKVLYVRQKEDWNIGDSGLSQEEEAEEIMHATKATCGHLLSRRLLHGTHRTIPLNNRLEREACLKPGRMLRSHVHPIPEKTTLAWVTKGVISITFTAGCIKAAMSSGASAAVKAILKAKATVPSMIAPNVARPGGAPRTQLLDRRLTTVA